MYDLNFFESYLNGKQSKTINFPFGRLIAVLLVVLAAWPLFNLGYTYYLKRETASLETEVTSNEKYSLLQQKDALEISVDQLKNQLNNLKKTDTALKDREWLNEPFLFDFLSTVPKDMQIEKLTIDTGKKVQLSGNASNKPAIAEFERNLRETERFDSLYIDTILNNNGSYSFTISFVLKDVGADAAD